VAATNRRGRCACVTILIREEYKPCEGIGETMPRRQTLWHAHCGTEIWARYARTHNGTLPRIENRERPGTCFYLDTARGR
jgi:hypothetical protein